jgi:hypothetical protein
MSVSQKMLAQWNNSRYHRSLWIRLSVARGVYNNWCKETYDTCPQGTCSYWYAALTLELSRYPGGGPDPSASETCKSLPSSIRILAMSSWNLQAIADSVADSMPWDSRSSRLSVDCWAFRSTVARWGAVACDSCDSDVPSWRLLARPANDLNTTVRRIAKDQLK